MRGLGVLCTLVFTTSAPAWADLEAVDAGIRRVHEKCLADTAIARGEYAPRFGRIDPAGYNTPEDSLFLDGARHVQASGLPTFFDGEEYEQRYARMRTEVVQFAKDRGFDDFQRACLAKCAAYHYFEDTMNGWQRFSGGFDDATGDCVQSTAMAVDIAHGMGLGALEGHTSARITFTLGGSHAFPMVTVDGREFVMNANWPEPCTFRFSERWESHRTYAGEFRPLHHVNYASAYEAAFQRQVRRREARELAERERAERAPDTAVRPGRRAP